MKYSKLTSFFSCAFAILLVSTLSLSVAKNEKNNNSEIIVDENISNQPIISENTFDYNYILKSYEGKIAVFTKNSDKPEMIFDVYSHHLPEHDRLELDKGIYIEDYTDLIKLIEDYTS